MSEHMPFALAYRVDDLSREQLVDLLKHSSGRFAELQEQMTAMVNGQLSRQVRDFMQKTGQPVRWNPSCPPDDEVLLRLRLVFEEAFELFYACTPLHERDLVEHAEGAVMGLLEPGFSLDVEVHLPEAVDAIADSMYVLEGTAAAFGVHMKPVLDAVHANNMTKVGAPRDANGKIQKPAGWVPPDIAGILRSQTP